MINWQPGMTLEVLEEQAIKSAFQFYRGNKTATASSLGIAIRTLDSKLEIYKGKEDELQRRAEKVQSDLKASIQSRQNESQRHSTKSINENSSEQPVPVPKREEVQKMPQASAVRVHPNPRR